MRQADNSTILPIRIQMYCYQALYIMRPIAVEQSFVRYPLNDLLGTAAHVRLLRILADETIGPISAAEAAERTGLTETGARRALARLAKTGFVVRVGGGRSQQFGLKGDDVLNESLAGLFRMERTRYEDLIEAIRKTLSGLTEVRVAWLGALPKELGEPLEIALIADSESLAWLNVEVRRRIIEIEQRFDVTIEVRAFARADAPPVSWGEVTLLAGVPPHSWTQAQTPLADHAAREERALRLSEAIVELLEKDPSIVKRAARHLERLEKDDPGAAAEDLREWQAILETYSRERLYRFLVSTSPRANRLRQSSPFFAVLTAEERDHVVAAMEASR